jgi:glycosyltransferase involved in cell wall biosynthesis
MIKLAEDKNLCLQMGQAGQQKVKDYYSWEAKGKLLARVYKDIDVMRTQSTDKLLFS